AREQRPHLGQRVGLDDDEAAGTVEEGSRQLHAARLGERPQVLQVGGANRGSLLRPVGRVVADDDVEHGLWSSLRDGGAAASVRDGWPTTTPRRRPPRRTRT